MAKLTKATLIRLTPDEREALEAMADAQDRSLAYMVRQAVQEYLEYHPPQRRRPNNNNSEPDKD